LWSVAYLEILNSAYFVQGGEVKKLIFAGLVTCFSAQMICFGAVNKNLPEKPLNEVITEGAFKGGQAGDGFSLLDIKRVVSVSKKAERMIFEIGTYKGEKYSGQPGYFHAQLSKKPPELTIDFAQTVMTRFDSQKLIAMFKKSKLIKRTQMSTDPEDNSTNITMLFKRPVKARVYTLSPKDNSPKVVVDIMSN
jgi:hypothetical protein